MVQTTATDERPHILILLATTRQGRFGETVARWLVPMAESRPDMAVEAVDLRDWQLPYYDAPKSASMLVPADYDEVTRRWAALVGGADGFIIIVPEYNHGYPAVLKS